MSAEEKPRESQKTASNRLIETAIEEAQSQLDRIKAQAHAFSASKTGQIEHTFYDDMNTMARRMGMLKALITSEDATRDTHLPAKAAHDICTAVRCVLRPDIASE